MANEASLWPASADKICVTDWLRLAELGCGGYPELDLAREARAHGRKRGLKQRGGRAAVGEASTERWTRRLGCRQR